jgi:zinc D-Ala-D-Ala carboxypeptidase
VALRLASLHLNQTLLTGILVKYFKIEEFNCQETGNNLMNPIFLERLDELRHKCGFPFVITSGYRDPTHSIEAAKPKPGTHAQGIAADIQVVDSVQRHILLTNAFLLGFSGIGVDKSFIHVDIRDTQPVTWVY